jgi:hypothetical protein
MDLPFEIISNSLKELYENDSILIDRQTKEESINHHLAKFVEKNINLKFQNTMYSVDVEYNRNITGSLFNGQINKIISWPENTLQIKEVIPDIIVHKRGSNESNYLCIEAKKKYNTGKRASKDLNKILGLLESPYNYKYGCLIEYLPDEEFFEVIIIRKNLIDYESERRIIYKPKIK